MVMPATIANAILSLAARKAILSVRTPGTTILSVRTPGTMILSVRTPGTTILSWYRVLGLAVDYGVPNATKIRLSITDCRSSIRLAMFDSIVDYRLSICDSIVDYRLSIFDSIVDLRSDCRFLSVDLRFDCRFSISCLPIAIRSVSTNRRFTFQCTHARHVV